MKAIVFPSKHIHYDFFKIKYLLSRICVTYIYIYIYIYI